jgi:hypothetical protein
MFIKDIVKKISDELNDTNLSDYICCNSFPHSGCKFFGLSSSVISYRVYSNLLQKQQKSVKGPDGVSTAGTPMPKLKPKRNIILRRTINQ